MKKLVFYSRLILLTISILIINGCATIIYNAIPLKDISKTSGKYYVGTQNYYLVDSSRSMWFTDDISGPREISVKIWYPADEKNLIKKAPYVDDEELISEALSNRLGVPKALMKRAGGIECNSWLAAIPIKGNFPILYSVFDFFSCSSVLPTDATSGLVYTIAGIAS